MERIKMTREQAEDLYFSIVCTKAMDHSCYFIYELEKKGYLINGDENENRKRNFTKGI
jgi:hypothetical protein